MFSRRRTILRVSVSIFALCATTPCLRASIITFDTTGRFENGSLLSGTVVIDNTLGRVTSIDLTLGPPSGPQHFVFILSQSQQVGAYQVLADTGGGRLELDITAGTLVGYTGGPLFIDANHALPVGTKFLPNTGPVVFLTDGALTRRFGADVPEPSAMALWGLFCAGLVLYVALHGQRILNR